MQWECHECGHQHAAMPEACEKCGTKPEVVRNVWRCQHCGQEGISSAEQRCPGCGVDRALGVETAVDASARVEGEQARRLAEGQWRFCAYCDVQVPPVDAEGQPNEDCPTCHGPLSEATREAVEELVDGDEAGGYRAEATRGIGEQAPSAPPAPRRRIWPYVVVPLVLLVGGVGLWLALRGPSAFVVSAKRWSHTVSVERFGPVQEERWVGEVPAGARQRSCTRKVHHHDRVARGTETVTEREADGRTCVAHGYKKKGGVSVKTCTKWQTRYREVQRTRTKYVQVPIYRQKCRYTVDRWHEARKVSTDGDAASEPRWPGSDQLQRGERAGARKATYELTLSADGEGKPYKCRDLAEWKRLPLKARVLADVSVGGEVKKVELAR